MTAMKQNLINETYSPLVRMMVTILVKTTGLMAFNKIWKCDINNKKKTDGNQQILLISQSLP